MASFIEIDSNTKPDKKGRFGTVISGFSRYNSSALTVGREQIGALARFILNSFIPGRAPVIQITIVGHADFDVSHAKEQQVSADRAQNTQMALTQEVLIRQLPLQLPDRWNRVRWDVSGVGASEPDDENVRQKKTPQNMSEEDRKRNRRVVVVLTTDDPTIQINIHLTPKDVQDILNGIGNPPPGPPPPPPPPTQPPFFKPTPPPIPVSDPIKDFIKKVQDKMTIKLGNDWEGKVDPDPFFQSLKDAVGGKPPTFDDFMKEWQQQEDARRKRQENPPEREPKQPGL
jgi:hypothetical protein